MNPIVIMYIIASSKNPDYIDCPVPWKINEKEIFFGPCKKNLRMDLKNKYLFDKDHVDILENIYIIGVNGSNSKNIRKIVFVGKVKELMTFDYAYNKRFKSKEYEKMRNVKSISPLHVETEYHNGRLVYKRRQNGHHEKDWQLDLNSKAKGCNFVNIKGDRDCCMLLQNIHFAKEGTDIKGMIITDKMIKVLCIDQPEKKIDNKAIFGYRKNGSVEGKTGRYHTFDNKNGKDFMKLIIGELKG